MSRGKDRIASHFAGIKGRMITKHRPSPDQDLARCRYQRRLLRLACADQPLRERPQGVLSSHPAQRSQEQAPAHRPIALARDAAACAYTAATTKGLWGQSTVHHYPFGIALTLAQCRVARQHHHHPQHVLGPYAGHRSQPFGQPAQLAILPYVALERLLQHGQFLLQRSNHSLQATPDRLGHSRTLAQRLPAVLLLAQQLLQSLASPQQQLQLVDFGWQWLPVRWVGLGTIVRQHTAVKAISLGALAAATRPLAYLGRIGTADGPALLQREGRQGQFIPTGRFEERMDRPGLIGLPGPFELRSQSLLAVGRIATLLQVDHLALDPQRGHQSRLGDSNTTKHGRHSRTSKWLAASAFVAHAVGLEAPITTWYASSLLKVLCMLSSQGPV